MSEELNVVNFTNIDNQDFEGMWGGQIEIIKAGQTRQFPKFLAEHYCKHLVNKMLIRQNQDWSAVNLREELEKKILGEAKAESVVAEKGDDRPVFVKGGQIEQEFAEKPKEVAEINPLKCPKCDFVGKTKAGLKIHIGRHHKLK